MSCLRQNDEGGVPLLELFAGATRSRAANLFLEALLLKTKGLIELVQDEPFKEITAYPPHRDDNVKSMK